MEQTYVTLSESRGNYEWIKANAQAIHFSDPIDINISSANIAEMVNKGADVWLSSEDRILLLQTHCL